MAPEEIAVLEVLMKSDDEKALVSFRRIVAQCEWNRQRIAERATDVDVKQDEIDYRRRRMELAQAILNESNLCDLEKLAEIVWPEQGAALPIHSYANPNHWCMECGRWLMTEVTDPALTGHKADCPRWIRETSPTPDISKPSGFCDGCGRNIAGGVAHADNCSFE